MKVGDAYAFEELVLGSGAGENNTTGLNNTPLGYVAGFYDTDSVNGMKTLIREDEYFCSCFLE